MTGIIGATIPVMRDESFDYSTAGKYTPSIKILSGSEQSKESKKTAEVRHKLEGDGLVHELVRSGKARFGCEVILKGAFWRETHIDDANDGSLEYLQIVNWDANNTSQKIFFRPVVVAADELDAITLEKKHNVTDFWVGENVTIPKFALLADAGMMGANVQAQSILKFKRGKRGEKDFEPFEMHVDKLGEAGRTHFLVKAGPSLMRLVRVRDSDLRRAVMITALTEAFGILRREYLSDSAGARSEISSCDILGTVYSKLIEIGVHGWEHDEFSPINAATRFEKLTWSEATPDEETGDG